MKCFSKISLVLFSCLSLTKGAVIPDDSRNVDLSSFFANLLGQQQTPATPLVSNDAKEVTKIAGVTANPTEIDDEYTQEDIRKYTKFLLNFVNSENGAQQPAATTAATTTTAVAATTSANGILNDIKDLSAELDQIKERRVDEIDELIDIIKNVSQRLDALEDTVEQSLNKQETVANTVADTKEVDLNNAEVDNDAQTISPINENDLKYAAIFNAFNKKNEEKIATMQQNEIKLLEEIKELLSNNNNNAEAATVNVETGKAVVAAAEEVKDKEVQPQAEVANAAPPPETSEESIIEQKNNESEEFEKLYQEISESIDDYKKMVSKKNENVTSDEQFTKAAMIRDKTKNIKQHINKLASLAQTEDQKKKLNEINDKYDDVESDHIEKVNNNNEVAKDEVAAKETAKENAEAAVETPNVISIDHVKKIINEVASSTTNEQQVDEVQRIIKEIQLTEQAESVEQQAANVNEEEAVGEALFEVSSNTINEDQVEEVRKFIKSIEAKAIIDDNLKKDEVIRKLIYDISANTTNEDQVKQIQRILEKIQLYNKFAEDKQQEREDNIAFGHEMAEEIQKSPEEISNDLKVLLVNLVNNAKTEEEAANVANIITQIKKHDQLIKEKKEQDEASNYVKVPNVETYMIDLDDGSSNQIYLKENQEFVKPIAKDEIPIIDLEEGIDENNEGSGKSLFVLGAFGVIALAGAGYTYRSRAKKLNDEFPFSDTNLPFSNSMNGLVVDKNFLFRKNSIPKPDNIINNDAVIRPSQPSWATSMLMDENNKKGLKENSIQMTEDPEQLLDEQLREIENKEKVIVKSNIPSVVITIDDNNATTEVTEAPKPKQKKAVKKPKLRRSMSHISLDKKIKEDKEEESSDKKSRKKKHQKKARKSKSLCIEKKIVEEDNELDEQTELSLNTSFILDAPSLLFNDTEVESEKVTNRKSLVLNAEKPKVPKRVSSCLPESTEILPALTEEKEEETKENSEISQEFAKELMEDYNKKFGEMEKEN